MFATSNKYYAVYIPTGQACLLLAQNSNEAEKILLECSFYTTEDNEFSYTFWKREAPFYEVRKYISKRSVKSLILILERPNV